MRKPMLAATTRNAATDRKRGELTNGSVFYILASRRQLTVQTD